SGYQYPTARRLRMIGSFLLACAFASAGQDMALGPPVQRLKVGMTLKEVEKLLGETHQSESWFGPIGAGAMILFEYPRTRVSVQYNEAMRVVSISLYTPPPKSGKTLGKSGK